MSLDAVARRAGVGIGTLYRHFPTRDALVEAAYRSEVAQLCGRGRRAARDAPARRRAGRVDGPLRRLRGGQARDARGAAVGRRRPARTSSPTPAGRTSRRSPRCSPRAPRRARSAPTSRPRTSCARWAPYGSSTTSPAGRSRPAAAAPGHGRPALRRVGLSSRRPPALASGRCPRPPPPASACSPPSRRSRACSQSVRRATRSAATPSPRATTPRRGSSGFILRPDCLVVATPVAGLRPDAVDDAVVRCNAYNRGMRWTSCRWRRGTATRSRRSAPGCRSRRARPGAGRRSAGRWRPSCARRRPGARRVRGAARRRGRLERHSTTVRRGFGFSLRPALATGGRRRARRRR